MGMIARDDGWELPDEMWEIIEPMLPPPKPHPLWDSGSDGKNGSLRVPHSVESEQEVRSRGGHLLVLDHVGDRMAIVRVQEARTSAPRAVCDSGEPEFLTVRPMRQMRVLEAFVTAQVQGEQDHGAVQRVLDRLRPFREGEFAMLEAEWLQIRAFLEANAALPR